MTSETCFPLALRFAGQASVGAVLPENVPGLAARRFRGCRPGSCGGCDGLG